MFWWTYFAYVPAAVERRLRDAQGGDRGTVARNVFTFGHFPIVFGLVLYAVAAKHVVSHPDEPMGPGDLAFLAGSVAFFVGGLLNLQWQAIRRLASERVAAIGVVAAMCLILGPVIAGGWLLALTAVVIGVMQSTSVRRLAGRRAIAR